MESEDPTGIPQQGCSFMNVVFLEEEPLDLSIKEVDSKNCQADFYSNEEPINLSLIKKDEQQCVECAALSANDEPHDCPPCRYKKIERVKRALTFSDEDYPPKKKRKTDNVTTKCDLIHKDDTATYYNEVDEARSIVEEDRADESEIHSSDVDTEKEIGKNIVKPFVPSPIATARMGFIEESDHHTFKYNCIEDPVIENINRCSNIDKSLRLNSDRCPINCIPENDNTEDNDKYILKTVHLKVDSNGNLTFIYKHDGGEEDVTPIFNNPYVSLNLQENRLLFKGKVIEGIEVIVHRDGDLQKVKSSDSTDHVQLTKDYLIRKMVEEYFKSVAPSEGKTETFNTSACTSPPEDTANTNSEVNLEAASTSKISSSPSSSGFGIDSPKITMNEEHVVSQQQPDTERIDNVRRECSWFCEFKEVRLSSLGKNPCLCTCTLDLR